MNVETIFDALADYERGRISKTFSDKVVLRSLDASGRTPLMVAAQLESTQPLQELIELETPLNTRTKGYPGGKSALSFAVELQNVRAVELLLQAGANPETKDSEGDTPLLIAIENDDLQSAKLLISNGASSNRVNCSSSPLCAASDSAEPEMVKLLLRNGADPDLKDNGGSVPIIAASTNGRPKIVELLLDSGANVNAVDYEGYTALMACSLGRNETVTKLLLSAGADKAMRNPQEETARDVAIRLNASQQMVNLLK